VPLDEVDQGESLWCVENALYQLTHRLQISRFKHKLLGLFFLVAQRILLIESEATVSIHLNTTTKIRRTVDKVDLPCFYESLIPVFGRTDVAIFIQLPEINREVNY